MRCADGGMFALSFAELPFFAPMVSAGSRFHPVFEDFSSSPYSVEFLRGALHLPSSECCSRLRH